MSRRDGPVSAAILLLPLALALLAEAAWIAVLAGLLEAFSLHAPVTGIPELLVAAVAGLLAARTLGPRLGERWAATAAGLAIAAGAIGWLASPEVRDLLRADGADALGPALGSNLGGWLAALAFVRGMAHARLPVDPQRLGTMVGVGVPGLALLAILGGMIAEPWRGAFLAAAQTQVLVFLVAGIAALALARLGQVGAGTRIDARRNPAWLLLLGGLVLASAALAVWVGAVAGSSIATVAASLLVPLLAIGFVLGFDRRSLRILFISLVAMGILGLGIRTLSTGGIAPPPGSTITIPGTEGNTTAQSGIALGVLVALLIAAVVVVMLLAGLWLRNRRPTASEDDEERVIDRGSEIVPDGRRRGLRLGRRPRPPADAVGAYLALLAALDGRAPVARGPGETPAEHAGRLRTLGHGTLPLDLLAADVGLVRFAGRTIGEREDRRAVARATRARQALLAVPVERTEAEAAAAAPSGPVTRGGRRSAGPGADVLAAEEPGTLGAILTRIRRGP